MKIAIITPYNNFRGGVETVNILLKKILIENGDDVDFITVDNYRSSIYLKVLVKLFGLPIVTARRFKSEKKHFNIVICNGEYGLFIKHNKAIVLFHGSYKGYRDYLKKLWSKKIYLILTRDMYIQKLSARGKYVVAVSNFIKEILENDGIKVDQVISNCVNTELFRPYAKSKSNNYLFVGSFNYYAKGFDVLESLGKEGLKIDCVTNEKPNSILGWINNIDNSEMPEVYNKYKMLIFPSRFEGLGLVPLEAMACGLPIVTSNVGFGVELKKVIPEFVVESYDTLEYLRKIKQIEKNYDYYSIKAREYVELYHSYENFKQKWIELIERIANDSMENKQ